MSTLPFNIFREVKPPEIEQLSNFVIDYPNSDFLEIFYNKNSQPEDTILYNLVLSLEDTEKEPKKLDTKKEEKPKNESLEKFPSVDNADIELVFKQIGLTTINGKTIHFGNKGLRSWGGNSYHKVTDKLTGNAMARDISIVGGTEKDYDDFKNAILKNPILCYYLDYKGWGIINESSAYVRLFTHGTGPHFHFGPDRWAVKIWKTWKTNPTMNVNTFIPPR